MIVVPPPGLPEPELTAFLWIALLIFITEMIFVAALRYLHLLPGSREQPEESPLRESLEELLREIKELRKEISSLREELRE